MATSLRPTLTIQRVGDLSEGHTASRKPREKEKGVSAQTHVVSSPHHGVTTAWPALLPIGSTSTDSVSWEEAGIQSLPDTHEACGSAPTSGRWGRRKEKS